ncbi:glycosyl transferase family 2 [Halorubrum sp. 48-1-W]|uniref:glycosyltransferase family 2 protein n=1 Tax=Halorubrum sp. 48-1-W TaxID=2249761 RepID=UPI000DCDA3A1|nr:glycosyltransferase family 2 protein [Halorubrum sp. 48-1-W]RAW46514.1 glycosyl transferase family 2 [Halorubrum sp. 48-1-W]
MDLSVVVPTLNGRDRLAACLDALAAHAPDTEVIVVNGPSADGTTGMVRDRDDVDVLVEISDRTVNVARNAGIEVAGGDAVALVDYDKRIGESWLEGVREGLVDADVVTGPVRPNGREDDDGRDDAGGRDDVGRDGDGGRDEDDRGVDARTDDDRDGDGRAVGDADGPERRRIAGRSVTYFAGGNVAFRREALRDLDGFDEYLRVGGARDAAHRLARMDREVAWRDTVAVREEPPNPTAADGGRTARDWGWKYRALAYRLVKNYGIRPSAVLRTGKHAVTDAASVARDVVRGEATPSGWVANGRDVVAGVLSGGSDGLVARARDRSPARNPNGISTRADRAVARYDVREGPS